MRCPACGGEKVAIKESRFVGSSRWRRRNCIQCDHKWTTYEVSSEDFDIISRSKKSGNVVLEQKDIRQLKEQLARVQDILG